MRIQFDSVKEAKDLLYNMDSKRLPILKIDIARLERLIQFCDGEFSEYQYISIEFMCWEIYPIIDKLFTEHSFYRVKKVTRYGGEIRVFRRDYLDCFGQEYQILSTQY